MCGSDGITYTSQCELEEAACMLPQDIKMVYTGQCEGIFCFMAVKVKKVFFCLSTVLS